MQVTFLKDGYKIGHEFNLKGKVGIFTLTGNMTYNCINSGLTGVADDVVKKYFIDVGKELYSSFAKAAKYWESTAINAMTKAEEEYKKEEDAVIKKYKGTAPTGKQLEQEKNTLNSKRDAIIKKIRLEMEISFKAFVPLESQKAHKKVIMAMKKAEGNLKASWRKGIFVAFKVAVVVAATVIAFVALGPLGAAVVTAVGTAGIVAASAKGLDAAVSAIKDIKGFLDERVSTQERAKRDIDLAVIAIEKARNTMEAYNSAYDALTIKFAIGMGEIDKLEAEIGKDKSKALDSAKKDLATARSDVEVMRKGFSGSPKDKLEALNSATQIVQKVGANLPGKGIDNVKKVTTQLKRVASAFHSAMKLAQ